MKILRRVFFGMLASLPLAIIAPFRLTPESRTLAWKTSFKATVLSPEWMHILGVEPLPGFNPRPEEVRNAHLKMICKMLEIENRFITVKL